MICKNCGAECAEGTAFCMNCGTKIEQQGEQQQWNQQPWNGQPQETGQQWNQQQGYQQWNNGQPNQQQWNGQQPLDQSYGQAPYGQNPYGQNPYPYYGERKTSGFAVASLVLGLIGIFLDAFFLVPSILAIVFAAVSRKQTNAGYKGRGMAIAGLVLGIIFLAIYLVAIISGTAYIGLNGNYFYY